MPRRESAISKQVMEDLLARRKRCLDRIEKITAISGQVSALWDAVSKVSKGKKTGVDDPSVVMTEGSLRSLQAEMAFYARGLLFLANRLRELRIKDQISDTMFLSLVDEDVARLKSRLLGLQGRSALVQSFLGDFASKDFGKRMAQAIVKLKQLEKI